MSIIVPVSRMLVSDQDRFAIPLNSEALWITRGVAFSSYFDSHCGRNKEGLIDRILVEDFLEELLTCNLLQNVSDSRISYHNDCKEFDDIARQGLNYFIDLFGKFLKETSSGTFAMRYAYENLRYHTFTILRDNNDQGRTILPRLVSIYSATSPHDTLGDEVLDLLDRRPR